MGEKVKQMLDDIMPAILSGSRQTLREIRAKDDEVDLLYAQILDYMGELSKGSLTDDQTGEFLELMAALADLEHIGDTIETNLVDLGMARIGADVAISEPTRKVLRGFHDAVRTATHRAIDAVANSDSEAAEEVIAMKSTITRLSDSAAVHQASRLVAEEPKRIPAYTIEIDIIEKQKRIYYFAKRMAKTVTALEEPPEREEKTQLAS